MVDFSIPRRDCPSSIHRTLYQTANWLKSRLAQRTSLKNSGVERESPYRFPIRGNRSDVSSYHDFRHRVRSLPCVQRGDLTERTTRVSHQPHGHHQGPSLALRRVNKYGWSPMSCIRIREMQAALSIMETGCVLRRSRLVPSHEQHFLFHTGESTYSEALHGAIAGRKESAGHE